MLNLMTDPQQPPVPQQQQQPFQQQQQQQFQQQPTPPPYANAHQAGGYPTQAPHPGAVSAPGNANPTGRLAFLLGIVAISTELLTTIIIQSVIRNAGPALSYDFSIIGIISGLGGVLGFAAGLAALVLGLIGIRKVGAPHAQAGIATGLGSAVVASASLAFLLNVTASLYY